MKFRPFIAALAVTLLVIGTAQADTLKLKNGTVLKGKVIRFSNGEFTIMLDSSSGGVTTSRAIVSVADIESIEFDSPGAPAVSSSNRPSAETKTTGNSTGVTANSNRPPAAVVADGEDDTTPVGATHKSVPSIRAITVNVGGKDDWTSTPLVVTRGQKISITASGTVDLGNGHKSGPEGIVLEDKDKLLPNWNTGSLIAVIGDDNNDFVFIGRSHEFVAQRSGRLFLSVNEGNLKDNSGSFTARVEVQLSTGGPGK